MKAILSSTGIITSELASTGFVQMLSEARKYKLFLTMAEQSTSQQDEQRLVDIILANYVRIAAVHAQEPMSGVTIVVDGKESAEVARRVIESSRALYAKTIQQEASVAKPVPAPISLVNASKKPSTTRRTRTSHVSKQVGEELSGITSLT